MASGLLNNSDVVFYHPCDSAQEHQLARDWNSTVDFGSGTITSGVVGLSDSATLGVSGVGCSGGLDTADLDNLIGIDDTRALFCYDSDSTTAKIGVVGISGGQITSGNFIDIQHSNHTHQAAIAKLTENKFVCVTDVLGTEAYARVIDVSGYTVAWAGDQAGFGGVDDCLHPTVVGLTSERFMTVGSPKDNPQGRLQGIIGQVSGGSISGFGDYFSIQNGMQNDVGDDDTGWPRGQPTQLSESCVAITYAAWGYSTPVPIYAALVNITGISGEVVSSGTLLANGCETHAVTRQYSTVIDPTNPSGLITTYTNNPSYWDCNVVAWSVSGNTVTPNLSGVVDAARGKGPNTVITDDANVSALFRSAYWESPLGWMSHYPLRIEGSGLVHYPPSHLVTKQGPGTGHFYNSATRLDINHLLGFVVDKDFFDDGCYFYEINIHSLSGLVHTQTDDYPSMSGAERFTLCMWATYPTTTGDVPESDICEESTITIERGYQITLSESGVSLGSGTASWSGADLTTFFASANDGNSRFLVFDFEHDGGGTWGLQTSINGSGWVDHGAQTNGSTAVVTQDTQPSIQMLPKGCAPPQTRGAYLLDEVVLWRTQDQFSLQELSNLYELSQTYNAPMDEYATYYGTTCNNSIDLFLKVAYPITASGDLFIHGVDNISESVPLFVCVPPPDIFNVRNLFINGVFKQTGSGDLFVGGHGVTQASGDLSVGGYEVSTSSGDLFIVGPLLATGSTDLSLWGNESIIASGDLNVCGHRELAVSGDLFIHGWDNISGSVPLFVFAPPPDIFDVCNLFTAGPYLKTDSSDLFVHGHDIIQASGDFFVEGHGIIASSGNLFIPGPQLATESMNLFIRAPEESGLLAQPIDWLLQTTDYYPQIVGTLDGATSVNIRLWEITDGQNTLTTVGSSGCYQIGNTGRWAWSTANLPTYTAYQQQYFYMMTANNADTFTGQFFLELPENQRWIHPSNRTEYLK